LLLLFLLPPPFCSLWLSLYSGELSRAEWGAGGGVSRRELIGARIFLNSIVQAVVVVVVGLVVVVVVVVVVLVVVASPLLLFAFSPYFWRRV
jgi:signal transduction histidine kinase